MNAGSGPPLATLLAGSEVLSVGRDPWSGKLVLSNSVSRERITYDGYGSMFLDHGDGGDSVLICVRPGDMQHEGLEFKVYLVEMLKRTSLASLLLRCGAVRQECKLQIGIFQLPGYFGTHMRLNLHEVYDVLAKSPHQRRWTCVSRN